MKNEAEIKSFGIHLRKVRERKSWSQQRLADEADMAKQSIQRIEWGQSSPTLDALLSISKALEIPLDELLKFQ